VALSLALSLVISVVLLVLVLSNSLVLKALALEDLALEALVLNDLVLNLRFTTHRMRPRWFILISNVMAAVNFL
jgi:hypothetical protein